jgi:hypothetical protein
MLCDVEFGETAQPLAECEQPFVAPRGIPLEISQAISLGAAAQRTVLRVHCRGAAFVGLLGTASVREDVAFHTVP